MPPFPGTSCISLNMVLDKMNDLGEALDVLQSNVPNIMPQESKSCSRDNGRKTREDCFYKRKAANGCHSYQDGIVSCGRRQSEDKRQKVRRDSNGGGNDGKSSNRSLKGFENNSSSSGGNSGADGNGEDNDRSDDDDSYDYEEEDDDYEEEEEEEEEEEYDQDDEDDNDNVVEEKKPKQRNVKQEREKESSAERRCQISSVLGNPSLMTNNVVEGTQPSLEPLQSSTEHSLAPAQPGTPVVLHGFICHETVGGVLVVNIQWRNRSYCGSLIDSSRHVWATPRFEESGCTGDTGSLPHKGGKGKKLRDNSLSSPSAGHSKGSNSVHATPHKHKLRGRKRHVNSNSKSPGLQGKKKLRNHDDESDDGVRPGKRSCTLKSRGASPQPSPTLIECPEPNCNKKYKHINGLRYHQAHAHLEPRSPQEETNPSDQSASASPSPIEEFKEPETKSTGRWKSSTRSGVRSRSVSPFTPLSTSSSSVSERNTSTNQAGKTSKGSLENSGARATKNRKSPCTTTDEQKENSRLEGNEAQNSRIDKVVKVEELRNKEEQNAKEKEHKVAYKEEPNDVSKAESQKKLEFKSEACVEERSANKHVESQAESKAATEVVDIGSVKKEEPNIKPEKTVETEEVVWETVIDSGRGIQGGPDGVNIEDAIDVGQEENIISIRKGASLLGIEVEDISENEEEIDPGKDDSYPNKDGFLPIERQRELHYRAFATEQVDNVDVQDRTRAYEFNSSNSLKPIGANERQREDYANFNICSNQYSSEVKIIKPKGQRATMTQPSLVFDSEQIGPDKSEASDAVSIESLVAKSMSRSAVEPPLTNADSPADRYKSYNYRSFGDKSCPPDLCEQSEKSDCITTLAPVRQLETVSHSQTSQVINSAWKDVSSNSSLNRGNTLKADPYGINWSDRTLNNSRSPSRKLATSNDFYSSAVPLSSSSHSSDNTSNYLTVVPSGQHRTSPKMSTKVFDSESASNGEKLAIRSSLSPHRRSPFQKSLTSEHSVKTAYKYPGDGTSFGVEKETSNLLDSKQENQTCSGTVKTKDNMYSKATERFIPDIQLTPDLADTDLGNSSVAVQGETTPKEDDHHHALKSSSQLFSRQLLTLPRHSRLTVPQLPIGVARPYHHGSMEHEVSGTSIQEPPIYSLLSAGEGSAGDIDKAKFPKKPGEDKTQEVPVGEVLSVGSRRSMPAIHAGLPSVVPATAHALNTRSSPGLSVVHAAHKASKSSNEEDQATLEAKGEPSGRDTVTYSGRPMGNDVKEQHEKKTFQVAVGAGNSSTGALKGKSSKDAGTDFDGSVRKNEGGSWMTRNEVGSEPPHLVEPEAQQVERLSAEQLKVLQKQVELQQHIYHQFAQGNLEMVSQLMMLHECHFRQENDKERAVGKSLESKEAIQADIECHDKQKTPKTKEVNELGSPTSFKATKTAAEGQKKVPADSYLVDSHPEQRGLLSAQPAAQQSGDGAVKNVSRISFDEPLEKKPKMEYQRNDKTLDSELERQKYRIQEEILQKESMEQKLSMFRQLESNLHQSQLLPKKHNIGGPEMKDSQLAEIDEDLADVKAVRKEGILVSPQRDKSIKSLGSTSKHHYGSPSQELPDNQTKYDSQSQRRIKPYDGHQKPTSLNLSSSRMSHSPGIAPNKDVLEQEEARGSERSASAPVPSNFVPARFQAYLQQFPQIAFDPSGPIYQQPFLPGLLMGMPVMSSGSIMETSSSPTSSLIRVNQEEATNPRRTGVGNQMLSPVTGSRARSPRPVNTRGPSPGLEKRHYRNQDTREHSPRPLGNRRPSPGPDDAHYSNQDMSSISSGRSSRASSSRGPSPNPEGHRHGNQATSRERSPRTKGEYREKDHVKLLAMQESRYRSDSPQNTRHFTDSHDGTLAKSPSLPSADHHLYRSGVISNNLVVRRGEIPKTSSIPSSQLEEEMLRKQRTGADYGEPTKHSRGYLVHPALLDSSPYSAGISPATTRRGGSGTGRYLDSRK